MKIGRVVALFFSPTLTTKKYVLSIAKGIREALKIAQKDDIIVIAGKGHEPYQILKDRTIHFDDREQVEIQYKKIKVMK
jgi:UDP-N-acetylmuramyl tripeptide synthase